MASSGNVFRRLTPFFCKHLRALTHLSACKIFVFSSSLVGWPRPRSCAPLSFRGVYPPPPPSVTTVILHLFFRGIQSFAYLVPKNGITGSGCSSSWSNGSGIVFYCVAAGEASDL